MSSHIVSAIMSFAYRYSQEPWFEGVFWGGSSLYKPVDQNTDIDVFVVANDYLPARIHGTTICNGLTIEYFVNPISRLNRQMLDEIESIHDYWVIKIYAFSKLLMDKAGKAKQLQETAYNFFQQPFSDNDAKTVAANYSKVWDSYNDYIGLEKSNYKSDHMFFETLKSILHAYCYQQQVPLIPWNKCQELMTDLDYRTSYHLKTLPDETFCKLFLRCFDVEVAERRSALDNLYGYITKNSGFNPGCFEQIK